MNKYSYLLNILINKILFILERYNYNNNKLLALKKLFFISSTISKANILLLLLISLVILKRPFRSIVKNNITRFFEFIINSEVTKRDISILANKRLSLKRYRLISTSRAAKERHLIESKLLDIAKIKVEVFYYLAPFKKNKLFFLIINKIYILLKDSLRT